MREAHQATVGRVVAVVVVLAVLAMFATILLPTRRGMNERAGRAACLANVASIGRALALYKGANEGRWPWIGGVTSEWAAVPTGTNRTRDPNAPGGPAARSITALMFLLVREGNPAGLFTCPGAGDRPDGAPAGGEGDRQERRWDFPDHRNVSYSWQAPVWQDNQAVNGIGEEDRDVVVLADKTPQAEAAGWNRAAWDPALTGEAVRPHMSRNHQGGRWIAVLRADLRAGAHERPDVGSGGDMIYTASGSPFGGSQRGSSISVYDHSSPRDSFLIGPVRGDPNARAAP